MLYQACTTTSNMLISSTELEDSPVSRIKDHEKVKTRKYNLT